MNRKIWNYFEIAAKLATKNKDRRHFLLAAIGIRSDGVMVASANAPSEEPRRECHAEYRLSKKLDVGATVYVARVRIGDGTFGMAKPCDSCFKALASKGVKKIYYTIEDDEFGTIDV